MDQFKIVFLIYLIIQISSYIYTIYLVNKEEYFKNSTKVYKETYGKNNSYLSQQVEEKPDEFFEYSIKQTIYFNVIGNVIISAILIFYYLSTCSHIEDIEELIYKEKNARILENNE
jgi:ABC-type multidrug transport system permease subunit